jgi:hypothetical protein
MAVGLAVALLIVVGLRKYKHGRVLTAAQVAMMGTPAQNAQNAATGRPFRTLVTTQLEGNYGPNAPAPAPTPALASDQAPPGEFKHLSAIRTTFMRKEFEKLQAQLHHADPANAQATSSACVEVLKRIEGILKEICLANGLADDDGKGEVVARLVKKGVTTTKKLQCFGPYLIYGIKPLPRVNEHISPELIGRLFKINKERNTLSHESGILCQASKGLEFCVIGLELLGAAGTAEAAGDTDNLKEALCRSGWGWD